MAQHALDVYRQAWRTIDAAYAAPASRDWEPEIRRYMADPRALQVLNAINGLVEDHVHTTGQTEISANVISVEGTGNGAKVTIEACVDSTGGDLLDATGNSVLVPQEVGPRIKQYANVFRYSDSDGGWLLGENTAPQPYQPC